MAAIIRMFANELLHPLDELNARITDKTCSDPIYEEISEDKTRLLLCFEKFYFRAENYAALTVLVNKQSKGYDARLIVSGAGKSVLNISWGAADDYAELTRKVLEDFGFQPVLSEPEKKAVQEKEQTEKLKDFFFEKYHHTY